MNTGRTYNLLAIRTLEHARLLRAVVLLLLSVVGVHCSEAWAQTIHPYGLAQLMSVSDNSLSGTARFVAMSGAMTAVGGDPTAVKQNPAGLGVYRHSQFSLSADGTFHRQWQLDGIDKGSMFARWHLSQVSYVFAFTHPERVAGVVGNNLMISYARRPDVMTNFILNDRSGRRSSATNWVETVMDEYGYRNDIDLHYAMNISNRFYWGIGFSVEWLQMRQTIGRWEYMSEDKRGVTQIYELSETFMGKSAGCAGSIGFLAHPIQALRLGVSLESPVIGRMNETDYYTEIVNYPGSASAGTRYDSPDSYLRWQMTTPLKLSAGLGLQWKNHGLLSLQYDMQYHKLIGVAHAARAGLEVAITNHFFLEAGYAYSTLYSRQHASAGLHYMGRWVRVGFAYAFSWSKGRVYDSLYYTDQGTYNTRENKIVLSFQWNS